MNTISAGNGFTVAITNYGRITAWGWDGHEEVSGHKQITLDEDEVYVAVSSGSHHTMALTSLGRIIGWGSNYWGQVSGIKPNSITHAINTHKYVAVSAGVSRTSAITTKGKIVEWGSSHISDIKLEDIKLNENESYILVSTGIYHTMALTSEGRLVGWGSNQFDKITGHENINLNSGEKYIDVNATNVFTIALTSEGRIFGWGRETDILQNIQNLEFNPNDPYVAISTNFYNNLMALTSKGRIVGWGADKYGQVSGVKELSPGVKYVAVSAGRAHTIALTSEGKIVGWGDDSHGAVSGWESIELGPGENYKKSSIDMALIRRKKTGPVMYVDKFKKICGLMKSDFNIEELRILAKSFDIKSNINFNNDIIKEKKYLCDELSSIIYSKCIDPTMFSEISIIDFIKQYDKQFLVIFHETGEHAICYTHKQINNYLQSNTDLFIDCKKRDGNVWYLKLTASDGARKYIKVTEIVNAMRSGSHLWKLSDKDQIEIEEVMSKNFYLGSPDSMVSGWHCATVLRDGTRIPFSLTPHKLVSYHK